MKGSISRFALGAAVFAAVGAKPIPEMPLENPSIPISPASGGVVSPPKETPSYDPSKLQQVIYWGQNDAEKSLGEYCDKDSGIDTFVLSSISNFGSGQELSGSFGKDCVFGPGKLECSQLAEDVSKCRMAGKKVIVSLGGKGSQGKLTSKEDAEDVAEKLWSMFGRKYSPALGGGLGGIHPLSIKSDQVQNAAGDDKTTAPSSAGSSEGSDSSTGTPTTNEKRMVVNPFNTMPLAGRPFGYGLIDGFDFDIENPEGKEYFPDLINKLRGKFDNFTPRPWPSWRGVSKTAMTDTTQAGTEPNSGGASENPSGSDQATANVKREVVFNHNYYVTGAPQCPLPEPNMGDMIQKVKFDKLFIQFYNNPRCSPGTGHINFDAWHESLQLGESKDAELYIGLLGGVKREDGEGKGDLYYQPPDRIRHVLRKWMGHPGFAGVMLWDTGNSDSVQHGGCSYAQNIKSIFSKGSICAGEGPVLSGPGNANGDPPGLTPTPPGPGGAEPKIMDKTTTEGSITGMTDGSTTEGSSGSAETPVPSATISGTKKMKRSLVEGAHIMW